VPIADAIAAIQMKIVEVPDPLSTEPVKTERLVYNGH
jgi:hypothetical protein